MSAIWVQNCLARLQTEPYCLGNLIEVSLIKMKASSMADRSGKLSDGSATGGRLVPEMLMMFRITSPQRTKIVLLGVALVLVIAATAFGQIKLNAWNEPFYNALQRRDLHGCFVQLVIFCIIAGVLLFLNVVQTWLNQTTKVKLREGWEGEKQHLITELNDVLRIMWRIVGATTRLRGSQRVTAGLQSSPPS